MRFTYLLLLSILVTTSVQSSPSSPPQHVLAGPFYTAAEDRRQQHAAGIFADSISYDSLGMDPESSAYDKFVDHFSSSRPGTSVYLAHSIPLLYPSLHATITLDPSFNPVAFASSPTQVAAGTTIKPFGNESTRIAFESYIPAARRRDGDGGLVRTEAFGQWEMEWKGETFIIVVAEWQEGFIHVRQSHIFSPSSAHSSALHLAVSSFASSLPFRNSVLVFSNGYWSLDNDLFASVQRASWKDVILDSKLKDRIQEEYRSFLRSEEVYKGLGVPWKRGLMFLGPPGNGKTISIKAIMKDAGVPSLYVKSFHHYMGDEFGIRLVFQKARQEAPCLLILEDLDSLITDQNRSFFLNELDGLEGNDGLLLIGSTNHADRLDGSLSNRPSRFDRKYNFPNPSTAERRSYALYWQHKLTALKSDIVFPDSLLDLVAEKTHGFSFAYLKEAFVSALLVLAGSDEHKKQPDFQIVLLEQIQSLRETLGHEEADMETSYIA